MARNSRKSCRRSGRRSALFFWPRLLRPVDSARLSAPRQKCLPFSILFIFRSLSIEGGTRVLRSLVLMVLALSSATIVVADDRQRWTMLVEIGGREIEGMPLAWSNKQVYLLARDGRLWDFVPGNTNRFRKTSSHFSSYSAAEIRARLERELAGKLIVTGTGHYLVAHPPGKEAWAQRFEELYRSIVNYFSLRGLRVHEPEFPLVAVVWGSREDFQRHAASEGSPVRPACWDTTRRSSNRVTLYDQGAGVSGRNAWQQNEATIIHEATHQMAFNTGIHNRFVIHAALARRGLGHDVRSAGRLGLAQSLAVERAHQPHATGRVSPVAQERSQDRRLCRTCSDPTACFETNPSAAYAEAWAWALFLTETFPQKFGQYVQKVASRPNFEAYPSARRMSDFTSVFGDDLRRLEKHFLSFMDQLPK